MKPTASKRDGREGPAGAGLREGAKLRGAGSELLAQHVEAHGSPGGEITECTENVRRQFHERKASEALVVRTHERCDHGIRDLAFEVTVTIARLKDGRGDTSPAPRDAEELTLVGRDPCCLREQRFPEQKCYRVLRTVRPQLDQLFRDQAFFHFQNTSARQCIKYF